MWTVNFQMFKLVLEKAEEPEIKREIKKFLEKNDNEHFLTPYTKINWKWIKDLDVRPETIKLLEENIGRTLHDINQSKILFDPPPTVMEIKTKVNKWDLIKLSHSKGNYKQAEKTSLRMGENNSKWNNW